MSGRETVSAPLRVLVVVFAASLALGCESMGGTGGGSGTSSGPAQFPKGDDHPLVGVQAPPFALKVQSGADNADTEALAGKVVIVDFWATWCGPCKESFPFYQGLVDQHGGDLVVIGVSEDDEPDDIPAFGEETGAKFALAWDEGKAVAKQYDPPTMPTSYVVDRSGIVRLVHAGFRQGEDEELIVNAVTALLAE